MNVSRRPTRGFFIALIPPALFAIDMVWENTSLSWERGPQMIGFTLLHTVGIILFPTIFASLVWAASTLVVPFFTRKLNLANIAGAIMVVGLLAIASLSYGFWVKLFVNKIASGPYAADFLVYMAATGELPAVKALIEAGVPINSSDRRGLRAIEAAHNANKPEVQEYLIAHGGIDKR